jgi:hypothetical protein
MQLESLGPPGMSLDVCASELHVSVYLVPVCPIRCPSERVSKLLTQRAARHVNDLALSTNSQKLEAAITLVPAEVSRITSNSVVGTL